MGTRALIVVLGMLAALAVVTTATAGGPTFRDRIAFSDVDPDFCGSGKTVLVDGRVVANGWIGESGGDPSQLLKLTFVITVTYTNPANGLAVVERWSDLETNVIVEGLEEGVHTHEFTNTGLKAMLKLARGGVLTRDAGSITYRLSFDADDNVTSVEIVALHGTHPAFFDDLFCSVVTEAIDL